MAISDNLTIQKVYYKDWDFILWLRNKQKDGFVQQHEISKEEHYEFMTKYGENYYVVGTPLPCDYYFDNCYGFVGVVNNDIRFAVHPDCQNKGIGTFMLKFIKERYPEAIGKVKHDNIASSYAFTKAGFQVFHSDEQFCYYTSKNIGFLETSELRKLINETGK